MKSNNLNKIKKSVLAISLLTSTYTQAGQPSSDQVFAQIEKGTQSASYSISGPSEKCDLLEDIVSNVSTPISPRNLKFGDFTAQFVISDNLIDKKVTLRSGDLSPGFTVLGDFEVQLEWDNDALSLQAGSLVADFAEKTIKDEFSSPENMESIATTGKFSMASDQTLLFCDLAEEKLRVTLKFSASHFMQNFKASPLSPKAIERLNKNAITNKSKIAAKGDNTISRQEELILSATTLGAEIEKEIGTLGKLKKQDILNVISVNTSDNSGHLKRVSSAQAKKLSESLREVTNHSSEATFKTSTLELVK